MSKEWVTSVEAAKIAQVDRSTITKLCRQGRVAGRQTGRRWEVSVDSLKQFVARRSNNNPFNPSISRGTLEQNRRRLDEIASKKREPIVLGSGVVEYHG